MLADRHDCFGDVLMCECTGASGTFQTLSEASHVVRRTISRTLSETDINMALPGDKSGLSYCLKAAQAMITIELVRTSMAILTHRRYRWQWSYEEVNLHAC